MADNGNRRGGQSTRGRNGKEPDRFGNEGGGLMEKLGRVPPQNIDAEEGLLACLLLDSSSEVMTSCVEAKITADYFYKPVNQMIYQVVLDLYAESSPMDEIIIAERLSKQNQLEEIGGPGTLTRLTNRIDTTAHALHWMEIVREKCLLRRLITTSTGIIDRCYNSESDLDNLLESVERDIFAISQDRVTESAKTMRETVDEAVQQINTILQRQGELSGLSTGFRDLDKMTFGFHGTQMIVLAARPAVGKTSFAMNIAENASVPGIAANPVNTMVFSLEMGAKQLALRMLCSHSGINGKRLMEGFMNPEEQKRLAKSAKILKDAPLFIDDSSQITIIEMRAKARRVHAKNPLGLIVIDYLQLVSGTDPRVPREQQISEISRGVKGMAKELDVPVLVLSQLNRESEKERRQPRLADLRESGAIEQDADVVLMLSKPVRPEDDASGQGEPGVRDLIIAKQRNGPVGTIPLTFIAERTRFEDYMENDL